MRAFRCPNCGQAVPFEAQQCPTCAVTVGYHLPSRQDRVPTVANADRVRPWLGSLRTLGAGLQLVNRRRLRIRLLLRRQFRARGTRAR
ncbi:MAG TPA: zinc-ribbon domain-containing protein [Mycobacterium sp.]|uniref:zinc-ribbon domain-containing protein n=1 Tax=Mycobacterium sp. TaxID=1785 RepID=UPI002F41C897